MGVDPDPATGRGRRLKGEAMEGLVERYFTLQGYPLRRNARVRGASGALHEVDILLETREGPVVVEVKNHSRPVPKEVVMKAYEVAQDIGARGAVVVSASGFTEGARRVAASLRVELLTLDDILSYIEAAGAGGRAVFLQARLGRGRLDSEASRRARRRLLLLRLERPEPLGCVYAPIYYLEGRVRLGEGRYRDVDAAFSAVTGLPLGASGGVVYEGAPKSSLLPPELAGEYRRLAGRRVARAEYVAEHGEAAWRRLERALRRLGLAATVQARPKVVEVIDDRPGLGELEEAASLLVAPKAGGPGRCALAEPRYSPGGVASLAERLYGLRARAARSIYAPVAAYRMRARDGTYRLLYLTAWTPRPLEFRPADPEAYLEPLAG